MGVFRKENKPLGRDPHIESRPNKLLFEPLKKGPKKALKANMIEDEEPDVAITSGNGQALVLTEKRVLILKPAWTDTKVNSYPYENITHVQFTKGNILGSVEITTNLNTPPNPEIILSRLQAQNIIYFPAKKYSKVQEVVNIIQERVKVVASKEGFLENSNHSVADEIGKLGKLLEDGLITEEEFTEQKRKLLSQ